MKQPWVVLLLLVVVVAGSACNGGGPGGSSSGAVAPGDGGGSTDGATTAVRGARDAAASTAGLDAASPAPTWTAIYQTLLVNTSYPSNCTGSSCHDPGTQKGLDLSSPANGYATISRRVVPGKPDASDLISVLQSGYMPQGRPHMRAADIDLIHAWIQAGAPND